MRRALLVMVVLVAACSGDADPAITTSTTEAALVVSSTSTSLASTTTEAPSTTTTTATEIDLGWFSVDLIVLESLCFDTAGASVTVIPDLWIRDAEGELIEWTFGPHTLIYEVHGGEAVNTYNLDVLPPSADAPHYHWSQDEHQISTASCEYELSTEVVRVIEGVG